MIKLGSAVGTVICLALDAAAFQVVLTLLPLLVSCSRVAAWSCSMIVTAAVTEITSCFEACKTLETHGAASNCHNLL